MEMGTKAFLRTVYLQLNHDQINQVYQDASAQASAKIATAFGELNGMFLKGKLSFLCQ